VELRSAATPPGLAPLHGHRRARFAVEALGLTVLLFVSALLVHEAAHLLVIRALGHDGVLLLRPWPLGVAGWSIYGLHVQPAVTLPAAEQLLVNFAGPFLAAIPIALLLPHVRDRAARTALVVNAVLLLFYAFIESLYVVLEDGLGVEGDWLTSAMLNYGLPLLFTMLVIGRASRNPLPDSC
jgi:hypothetical protein